MKKEIESAAGRQAIEALTQSAFHFGEAGTASYFCLEADRKLDNQQAVFVPSDRLVA